MPKKPRFVNQIRRLRTEYLKLTQPQFARLIGVSASMLQAVELGTRRITEDFANRVAYATGVNPECLLHEGAELRTLIAGTPYLSTDDAKRNRELYAALLRAGEEEATPVPKEPAARKGGRGTTGQKEVKPTPPIDWTSFGNHGALQLQDSFSAWKKAAGIQEADVVLHAQMVGHSLELLLRSAAKANPLKAYALGHSVVRWLHRTAQEFDVIKHMESVLADRREVPSLAPFLSEAVLDRDPSMEWLFYRGPESSASPHPAYAELAARNDAQRRTRFPWYGKRMAKEQKALPPKSGKKTRETPLSSRDVG